MAEAEVAEAETEKTPHMTHHFEAEDLLSDMHTCY